jgi:hypothetical protein
MAQDIDWESRRWEAAQAAMAAQAAKFQPGNPGVPWAAWLTKSAAEALQTADALIQHYKANPPTNTGANT